MNAITLVREVLRIRGRLAELQRYEWQPGDVVVILAKRPVSMLDGDAIKDVVRRAIGKPELPVLILDAGLDIGVVNIPPE